MSEFGRLATPAWESYRILADNSLDVVMEADPATNFTWVSPSVTEVLGWRPDELIGLSAVDIVHPDDMASLREHADQMNSVSSTEDAARAVRYDKIRMRNSSGDYRTLSFRAAPVLAADDTIRGHIVTLKDTTERDEALRALSVLTEANRVISLAQTEQDLLADMCRAVVKTGDYRLAWFAKPIDDPEKTVSMTAIDGPAAAYCDGLSISWGDRPAGNGPTGRCMRNRETTVIGDTSTDERFAMWRERAVAHGLRSSIGLPVFARGALHGALMVYSDAPNAFDRSAQQLLETLASDLGLGIERLLGQQMLEEQRRRLAESEARYRLLAEHASDVVFQTLAGGEIAWASESSRAVFGRTPDELVGKGPELIHPEDLESAQAVVRALDRGLEAEGELRILRPDGTARWVSYRAQRVASEDGEIDIYSMRDIDAEVRARLDLDFALGHDPLTGMPARQAMVERVRIMLDGLRAGAEAAVLCLGVDRLSAINEAYTHSAGDLVLTDFATRLVSIAGTPKRVGRGNGVEFLVLIPQLARSEDAAELAQRLLEATREPFTVGDRLIDVTASIGIAVGTVDTDPEQLLRDASSAMGQAKADGRDRFAFADPTLVERARHRLHVEHRVKETLERGLFIAHFQPIVDMVTREVSGYEGLVRGVREDGRPLAMPGEFMAVAEVSGLVRDIDLAMMRSGLEALAGLPEPLTVSLNISAMTLTRPRYLEQMVALVAESGVEASRLHLEVTETSLLSQSAPVSEAMASLSALGARWYVDDFGTGYSSIAHLRDLPISGLKLDVSFSAGIRDGHTRSTRLANALLGMALGLGLDTVAEGVETEVEARILLAQGWRHGQGYLYGKAAPLP